MEINMKGYNFESFKEKDIYTWEEIVDVIDDLESQVKALQEEIEDLKEEHRPDPHDEWLEHKFQMED